MNLFQSNNLRSNAFCCGMYMKCFSVFPAEMSMFLTPILFFMSGHQRIHALRRNKNQTALLKFLFNTKTKL